MKTNKIIFCLLVLLGCLCGMGVSAQTTATPLTLNQKKSLAAYVCLNGINTNVNYPVALKIYRELASQGDAAAYNSLGGMYKQGFGIKQNYDSARYFYKKGADLGNGKAAYNLGQMYKHAQGGPQDMISAVQYYTKSLALGDSSAYYILGYCYYKGMGVTQNYTKAVAMFTKGAALKNSACEYFLGLSYLGGYGIAKNVTLGKTYVQTAATQGLDQAIAFIANGSLKQFTSGLRSATIGDSQRSSYRRVNNTAEENLSGIWEGKIIRYDWSGKQIVEQKNISLQLDYNNKQLSGIWTQEDSITIRVTGHKEDSAWVFDNMQYLQKGLRPWQIKEGRFEVKQSADSVTMEGNVEQFSTQTMEPSSPTSIVLKRSASINDANGRNNTLRNSLVVYPNPFEQQLTVEFHLELPQQVSLRLFDEGGKTIYTSTQEYEAGKHQMQLTPSLPSGTYSVSIKGKYVNLNTLVIKK